MIKKKIEGGNGYTLMYWQMAFKQSKTIHVMDNRRGLQWLPWYAKSGYLEDRAITGIMQNIPSEMRKFLHLPIDIQKIIVLKNQPNPYDGWRVDNKEDEINIYIDKSMYIVDITYYHDQVEKINLICFHGPMSSPWLILDCSFNNGVLNITYHTPQNLDPLFNWVSQIVGDLNHYKMIYDFTISFVSTLGGSEKLIQKINHHFSHMKSMFSSSLSHESSTQKSSSKILQTHLSQFQIDKFNPHFIERYHNDKYVKMLQINPCKVISQVFSLPMEIQEKIAMSYYNDKKYEVWTLRLDGYKEAIEINAKEIWMELESKMSLIHLFHVHWPYQRLKISLNYVDHVNIKY